MVFDHAGSEVARHQLEHQQILPRPGWVEHDPVEIWERTRTVIAATLNASGLSARDLAAVGIANQRETTVVWNRRSGVPYANAIVWQDTRTDHIASALDRSGRGEVIRRKAGLPPATYFSGGKLKWLLENDAGLRADAARGDALFGTVDSWLLWHLTGGSAGGVHLIDVTNASRTMLMDLRTLNRDSKLCGFFGVPREMLPRVALQADILGVPVSRPVVAETTALGAAYAAGLAAGFWRDTAELRANWHESRRWEPTWSADRRASGYAGWKKAVDRTLDWVDVG
jgi:glycerol kinase